MLYIGIDPLRATVSHFPSVKLKNSESDKFFDALVQASVSKEVLRCAFTQNEVLQRVVLRIAINVMNNLFVGKDPANFPFHDNPMLRDKPLSGPGVIGGANQNMPFRLSPFELLLARFSAHMLFTATFRAESPPALVFDLSVIGFDSHYLFAANFAIKLEVIKPPWRGSGIALPFKEDVFFQVKIETALPFYGIT